MAGENKVELLWNCATTLEPSSHTHKLLKSYYMNMCRKLANNTLQIPKEKFSSSQMCTYCGCFWSESEFSLKLQSQHVAQKSKTKNLLEKLEKSYETGQRGVLNRKQKKRAKWLQKRIYNYIQIKCEQCKHKSFVKMEKPKCRDRSKQRTEQESIEVVSIKEETVTASKGKKKKKKKNKNKTAGLKLPQNPIPQKKSKTTTSEVSEKIQTSAIAFRTDNHSKTAKKKQKSLPGKAKTNKVVSNTQKQNSLLQMAALLKQQTAVSTGDVKSAAQKRLEALLK